MDQAMKMHIMDSKKIILKTFKDQEKSSKKYNNDNQILNQYKENYGCIRNANL